ncbi:hypothetical protein FV232_19660 [Methylobacterium sp. WL30]|uniref:hypothetical protein n=1 Tax=unclassified Methylobacterium TaxID=2615210 RepID=UPI0011C86DF5|nr:MULTISPECIES: hypothetical protein [unclassified Methylobacterium]TXM89026.1 hypothetical protein FV223_22825 [Methylobacterium sp. WL116]TXN27042.1 hypothetical protein FV225_22555 [Methylobacterium sp. WL93]TXN45172.1 hypothetical protein FV227_25540 [Methylobacterium sp. WL119]TXN64945.1 hypothetical protein FV232_19660 [Methylobacterium sp. WL30]
MPTMRTLIHSGSNDDRWFLCHGDDPADVFVFHEPNEPSGDSPSCVELAAFLASGCGLPEHYALMTMIGALVQAGHAGSAPPVRGSEATAAGAEPTPVEAAFLI